MSHCSSTAVVAGGYPAGGLVGFNEGSMAYCTHPSGTTTGAADVGGLVGRNGGVLSYCDSAGTTSGTDPIDTDPLATNGGDMVILGVTCGNNGSYTLNNGFTEGTDQSVGNYGHTGATGHKSASGVAETPSADFSGTVNRQVIVGFVVQAAGPVEYETCEDVQTAGFALLSDLDGDCYVNYWDLEIITDYWLNTDCDQLENCEGADFEPTDGAVDFFDYSDFAEDWMQCNDPEDSNCTPNW